MSGVCLRLGSPSPESRSSAVVSLLSHARTPKVPYSEQKRSLSAALLDDARFASNGELLQTMEKGVMYPVVHLLELPGPFAPLDDQLLGQDYFGDHFALQQGIYEEIRQHVLYDQKHYTRPNERNTAYILAGFKVLDGTFRDVMEDNWKDWTGARSLYINLNQEFGLHRFSLFRRTCPSADFATFSYVMLVECRSVSADNAVGLLDFVQRFRSHRMSGYLSVYAVRHLGLESYSSSSAGSTSDLSSTSESTSSEDRLPAPKSSYQAARVANLPVLSQLPAVEETRRLVNAGRRWQQGSPMTPIYENQPGYRTPSELGTTIISRSASSNDSTNGLGETDLSYSVGDSSVLSSTVGSGSDMEMEASGWDPRPSKGSVRRVWFEDCCLLEDVIAQAAERCSQQHVDRCETRGTSSRSVAARAKEYHELDEMLRNLQCVSVAPQQSVRRKLW
ncbi:conserved hypothetical protein [Ixodes scapularis]|uniref:DUF7153 domain-containing protein n=1 Tax=Ixodes scapularis TaxID=6945 RepID=B7QKP4_IXOSC|nr:conserved hypothetical protein [Ixodes scapularis]|eukprot:XP_002415749.1 conserved hypothetical protein [Ixodes scapularis]